MVSRTGAHVVPGWLLPTTVARIIHSTDITVCMQTSSMPWSALAHFAPRDVDDLDDGQGQVLYVVKRTEEKGETRNSSSKFAFNVILDLAWISTELSFYRDSVLHFVQASRAYKAARRLFRADDRLPRARLSPLTKSSFEGRTSLGQRFGPLPGGLGVTQVRLPRTVPQRGAQMAWQYYCV